MVTSRYSVVFRMRSPVYLEHHAFLHRSFLRKTSQKQKQLEYYPYDKYKSPHMETPTSNFARGGILEANTQSAKICLNFNFQGWGEVGWGGGGGVNILDSNTQKYQDLPKFQWGRGYSGVKYSKCQDLPKFQWGRGGYSGVKYSKCQDLPKFLWGEGGYSGVKYSKCQDLPKFQFFGGNGGVLSSEIPERGSLENLDKNLLFEVSVQKPAFASQIVSHILRMWRLKI